ncbi:MAG: hypothetical protein IPJ88_04450 [Myxococcales bacterium]|nr:MAG: hypothetical protein IPJ88_04450 [Myxococcales bacterium]
MEKASWIWFALFAVGLGASCAQSAECPDNLAALDGACFPQSVVDAKQKGSTSSLDGSSSDGVNADGVHLQDCDPHCIITAKDLQSNYFGAAVAVDGDDLFVAASDDSDAASKAGAAYFFERDQTGSWKQIQKITVSDAEANDFLGLGGAASMHEKRLIVGASYNRDLLGTPKGAAYIFEKNEDGVWKETQLLDIEYTAPNSTTYASSVVIHGDYAVVGAYLEDQGPKQDYGAIYIYKREDDGRWQRSFRYAGDSYNEYRRFGRALAFDGETLVVGAPGWNPDDSHSAGAGGVEVLSRVSDSYWDAEVLATPAPMQSDEEIGASVAVYGDDLAVGHLRRDGSTGAVSLYHRDASGAWSYVTMLQPSELMAADQFGFALSMKDDALFVGAPFHVSEATTKGAVFVYTRSRLDNIWSYEKTITAPGGESGDHFGARLDFDGQRLVVGHGEKDSPSIQNQGAVYVFDYNVSTTQP